MKWIWSLSLVVVLLLAACGAPEPDGAPPNAGAAAEQAAPADVQQSEAAAAETVAETAAVAEEAAAEPADEAQVAEAEVDSPAAEEVTDTVADIGPPPAFTTELHATEPASVALGTGQPQLVEFFAFW
ncbi:MAG: hypothetical protein R3A44_18935 [Caldilineaceae bacterium]